MSDQPPAEQTPADNEVAVAPAAGDSAIQRAAYANPEFVNLSFEAKAATDKERSMTLLQGIKLYPKAVGWSMLLSTCIVMEGYDLVLLGRFALNTSCPCTAAPKNWHPRSFYALPQFENKYGLPQPDGTNEIPARWKSGLSDGQQVGEILGLALCGLISERLGYRRTMMLALLSLIGLIFILFFAPNVKVLLVGEILCGIPWGYVTI
jgi:SP family general alpha glucoside:H+ symporter-like MFS transporter